MRIERDLGGQSTHPLAEYRYNGLHQRIYKRVDTETDSQAPGFGTLDQQHLFYYSAGWQIIEELVDPSWSEMGPPYVDRVIEYVWGARYIDDIIMRVVTYVGDVIPNPSFSVYYHLTDHQFSTVALIDSSAKLVERVTYDAYGMARHHWKGDLTGDGAVDVNDRIAMSASFNKSIGDVDYNVDADITRTGTVTSSDSQWTASSKYKAALPKGDLSAGGAGGWNTIGYCGYVFNPEVPTTGGGGGLYTVRFRHYDAELGRWLERDPLGYVDGMNLYGYGLGSPAVFNDPLGLLAVPDCAMGLAAGIGAGVWDFVSGMATFLWNLASDPIGTVNGIIDGVMELAAAVAEGDLMAVLAIVAPELHELIANWNNLSDYDKCRLIGKIIGKYGAAILSGIGMGRFVASLRAAKVKGKGKGKGKGDGGRPTPVPEKKKGCFLAGTLVLTAAGAIPIEHLCQGDLVWAHNHETGEWVLGEVERVFEHIYFGDISVLTIQYEDGTGEMIAATGNHPFRVVDGEDLADQPMVEELPTDESQTHSGGGRWTEARHLQLGDHFVTRTGRSATVAGLIIRTERVKVYNLEVADLWVYAVGRDGVLVHNSNVKENKKKGDAYRNWVADQLRKMGFIVGVEFRIKTPLGPRIVDIVIKDSHGNPVFRIETKTGGSRYLPSQRAKDKWIERHRGIPGCVIRD